MTQTLQQLQAEFRHPLDEVIRDALRSGRSTQRFFGMMSYQLGYVDENLQPMRMGGGKRFRPLLCLFACQATGGDWHDALSAACAIELLHNFSLVHDDIEDGDPARHHRQTVWAVWGEPHAINVGDALFALASRTMADAHDDADTCLALSRHFEQVALALTEGQFLDMSFETRADVTPAEYMDMIERKTAALIAFSLWSGGLIGRAPERTLHALNQFGFQLGRAFQIHDDIMGVWGDPHVTGKQPAKDIENRKKTWPVLVAAEQASPDQRAQLRRYFGGEDGDVDSVVAILDATDARRHARSRISDLLDQACAALTESNLAPRARGDLASLAAQLAGQ